MKRLTILFLLILAIMLGWFALGFDHAGAQEGTVTLKNPLAFLGVNDPGELVQNVFIGFAGLIAFLAIAFTVFNGFKLAIASTEEAIETAKNGLTWSVGGFVVALLAFTLVAATADFIGFDPSLVSPGQNFIQNPIQGPDQPGDFISVMFFIMQNFLGIIGFAVTLMIIYYGFRYVTAAGNEETLEKTKQGLKWAVIGLVITLLAFTIISGIRQILVFGTSDGQIQQESREQSP